MFLTPHKFFNYVSLRLDWTWGNEVGHLYIAPLKLKGIKWSLMHHLRPCSPWTLCTFAKILVSAHLGLSANPLNYTILWVIPIEKAKSKLLAFIVGAWTINSSTINYVAYNQIMLSSVNYIEDSLSLISTFLDVEPSMAPLILLCIIFSISLFGSTNPVAFARVIHKWLAKEN